MSEAMNQCCGCIRGLPKHLGIHIAEQEMFMCTESRYRLELEPKSTDTWHKPVKTKSKAPFVCGGDL